MVLLCSIEKAWALNSLTAARLGLVVYHEISSFCGCCAKLFGPISGSGTGTWGTRLKLSRCMLPWISDPRNTRGCSKVDRAECNPWEILSLKEFEQAVIISASTHMIIHKNGKCRAIMIPNSRWHRLLGSSSNKVQIPVFRAEET